MRLFFVLIIFIITGCAGDSSESTIPIVQQTQYSMIPAKKIEQNTPVIIENTLEETTIECTVFDDFSSSQDFRWGVVNDGVMGGRSAGTGIIENNALVFSGTIVTRGGGFSSLHGNLESGMLSEYNSVKLRAKSDGREYRITFRDSRWGNISHRAIIPFETVGEFEEITINFSDLEPAYFGRNVDADRFDKNSAREIGVILSDGVDGDFRLEIDEVRFCK